MSPNKRIFLNIVDTYGRSLFALACGLFSARWVLGSMGSDPIEASGSSASRSGAAARDSS